MAIDEARLDDVGSGLAPVTPGWFVVNTADAAWVRNEAFGGRCVFESTPRVLAERPGIDPQFFAQTGFTLAVLKPGKPSGMYHAEGTQEDFLVLSGNCLSVDRGARAAASRVGLCPLPARHAAHIRRHRRRAVRDLHDRRPPRERHDRLPALGHCARARCGRGERDPLARRSVRAVPAMAGRSPRHLLARPSLGLARTTALKRSGSRVQAPAWDELRQGGEYRPRAGRAAALRQKQKAKRRVGGSAASVE